MVIAFIFSEYLHVELRKRVYVPDTYLFLYPGYQALVRRRKDTEPESWNAIGLGDALHYIKPLIRLQDFIVQQAAVSLGIHEIYKALVQQQLDFH